MKRIMDISLSFIAAAATVVALIALAWMIGETLRPTDWRNIQPAGPQGVKPSPPTVAQFAAPCQRDGVLITSMDRLRAAVTMSDVMILRGGLDGRKISMMMIRDDADRFAQLQTSPDVTLEMLGRCDESLMHKHPQGYWLISSALVRESARRRGFVHPIDTPRAP